MIYVTHDQVEAMTLADRIVVLRNGLVEQCGTPMDLYERPANRFVAGFIGSPKMNFIEIGAVKGVDHGVLPDGSRIDLSGKPLETATTLGVRADALQPEDAGAIRGEITVIERLGDAVFAYFWTPWGQELVARFAPQAQLRVGERVLFSPSGRTYLFGEDGRAVDAANGSAKVAA